MIPEDFILSNLRDLPFIGPEIVITLALLILVSLGFMLAYRRRRLLFTILAIAALAGALVTIRQLPVPPPDLSYLSALFVWDGAKSATWNTMNAFCWCWPLPSA
ncbi:MAG: hypothetical protein P8X90_34080 [Desulfobacterales bacterium]